MYNMSKLCNSMASLVLEKFFAKINYSLDYSLFINLFLGLVCRPNICYLKQHIVSC